jgi:trans-aconitate 2-methyltransferase
MWDPGQYRLFGGERSRPFYELISRIGATDPAFVADIGCGPGELTADLCRRWPQADVVGVDSSAEMIMAAGEVLANLSKGLADPPSLSFIQFDARVWEPAKPVDVIVSNALLQWIPDHEMLLTKWVGYLAEGGWLAVQMPANHDEPTHRLLRELVGSDRWRSVLSSTGLNRQAADPAEYLDLLSRAGCVVDAWETTYVHVLTGENPVLQWISGTGLRPVIAALQGTEREEFMAEYGALLADAYPPAPYGAVFPFRRVFVVARR